MLTLAGFAFYSNTAPGPKMIVPGTKLVYDLESTAAVRTSAHIFHVDLFGDFSQVLAAQINGSFNTLSLSPAECKVNSSRVFFEIHVLSINSTMIVTNNTLAFFNGDAACGHAAVLPLTDAHWTSTEGIFRASFGSLNYSSIIRIDQMSGGAVGPSGTGLGDWPFWLSRADLSSPNALILYGLNDYIATNIGVTMTANVLPLWSGRTTSSVFSMSSGSISPGDQIFADKTVLPVATIFNGVPASASAAMVAVINRSNNLDAQSASYAFTPTVRYANGEILENANTEWANTSFSYKSWSWIPDLVTLSQPVPLGNGTTWQNGAWIFPGIVYNGARYATFGFQGVNASYYRTNGVLLYVTGGQGGDLLSLLPSSITRTFAVAYAAATGGQVLTLKLLTWNA